ncbi:MAG: adenylate/guanylate cyclase domain-containing protein [Cyanobacteria bacterium J06638_22]
MKEIVRFFIPDNIPKDVESQRKAKLTVGVLLIVAYFNLNYIVISYLIHYPGGLLSQIPLFIVSIVSLLLYKYKFPPKIIYPVYFSFCSVAIAITVFYSGGYHSILFPWLASTPIVAVLVWSKKHSVFSLFVVLVLELVFFYLYQSDYDFPNQIDPSIQKIFYLACNLGLVLILYWIAIVFENAKDSALESLQERNHELAIEKQKSEDLLLNILPTKVAEELKEKGSSEAKLFADVTIMFIDFVGFTNITEQMGPRELVSEIDYCFKNFDVIISKFGLEKIKTVGDAYIAAGGLPERSDSHALDIVKAAIAICEFMEEYQEQRLEKEAVYFEHRIGIHSGSVVAGIVGIKKFAYDIWGDAVNTAARMEQSSEPGRINISKATYDLVKDHFEFQHRGKVQAKNKGTLDMYFLLPTKHSAAAQVSP